MDANLSLDIFRNADFNNFVEAFASAAPPPSTIKKVYFGGTQVPSIYYGSTPVTAIYYGSTKVFG